MEILINQILAHKEAAALPSLLESGGLPALISGLSPVHRANLTAALKNRLGLPLFVVCPDDTAAEAMARDARKALDDVGMSIEEYTLVSGLPIGHMQFIEIAREIDKTGMKLLVFDEPTAVLTESEAQQLLDVMKSIAARGISIIFIDLCVDSEQVGFFSIILIFECCFGILNKYVSFGFISFVIHQLRF